MNGIKIDMNTILTVTKYEFKPLVDSSEGKPFNNLYVKNFPKNDFNDEDLRVISFFNLY